MIKKGIGYDANYNELLQMKCLLNTNLQTKSGGKVLDIAFGKRHDRCMAPTLRF